MGLIGANEVSGGSVYGVPQFDYSIDGVAGNDLAAALTIATYREATAIEHTASAYAAVVRQRQTKVNDLGQCLAYLVKGIATMDPKSNNTSKRSDLMSEVYEAGQLAHKYGLTFRYASISIDGYGKRAQITYADAQKSRNEIQYAMDRESNDLQQDIVALQSLMNKRDSQFSSASKIVNKFNNAASTTIKNIGR